jgi:6-phosphogluconolactonase (cycloisomerase 2 family)
MFDRRMVTAMLAGAAVAPKFARAEEGGRKSAFYSGVGNVLTHYEVDPAAAALARRGSVRMPGGIQYAWPHPSRKFLYVTSSTGGPGFKPGPDFPPNSHHLAAFRIGPGGELTPHGDMVRLKWRPIHSSVDRSGAYALVAYNFPSGISVHRINGDGTLGGEVAQPDDLDKGTYFHQVIATPGNETLLVIARGNNAASGKPEDPGSLHVFGFKNGVLSNLRRIAPNGGYGFGPRHLDIHPAKPFVYVSVERQNQLIVYQMTPDGDLVPEPLFTRPSLADPAHPFSVQSASTVHVHPNGRFVYQGNRSGVVDGVPPGVEEVDGRKVFSGGESNIAVFAIDQKTGEPTAIQHADIHAAHPRTFALDAGATILVAGSLAPTAVRNGGKVVDVPAGLSVFRVGADGRLDFVRKYDLDLGGYLQWWSGMVALT